MKKQKTNSNTSSASRTKLFAMVGAVIFILAIVSFFASNYITSMVRNELLAQKIYFPEKGSPALDPALYPDLQEYAGQQVDSPQKARAYANSYIGRHLKKVADGKVYAEVSSESMKQPENKELAGQKQTLFMGETLRSLLLTSFAFGMAGYALGAISILFLATTSIIFLYAFFGNRKLT